MARGLGIGVLIEHLAGGLALILLATGVIESEHTVTFSGGGDVPRSLSIIGLGGILIAGLLARSTGPRTLAGIVVLRLLGAVVMSAPGVGIGAGIPSLLALTSSFIVLLVALWFLGRYGDGSGVARPMILATGAAALVVFAFVVGDPLAPLAAQTGLVLAGLVLIRAMPSLTFAAVFALAHLMVKFDDPSSLIVMVVLGAVVFFAHRSLHQLQRAGGFS